MRREERFALDAPVPIALDVPPLVLRILERVGRKPVAPVLDP
jgi:hypothetical protein